MHPRKNLKYIYFLLFSFLMLSQLHYVKADDEGWVIDGCRISDKLVVGKAVNVTVMLKYTGIEPSVKKKFTFIIKLKNEDDELKSEVSKEVDITQPEGVVNLKLKGPKIEDSGDYTVTVENAVATLAVKQVNIEE